MKNKHNLKILDDGLTIQGQILETIFEKGENLGDERKYYSKDYNFYLCSDTSPQLCVDRLFTFGRNENENNRITTLTYTTPEKAKQVMNYINEFTVGEFTVGEFTEGEEVYVSDVSIESALEDKHKNIILGNFKDFNICVPYYAINKYNNGEDYEITKWKYIAKIPEENITITTDSGEKLSITREKAIELGFNI